MFDRQRFPQLAFLALFACCILFELALSSRREVYADDPPQGLTGIGVGYRDFSNVWVPCPVLATASPMTPYPCMNCPTPTPAAGTPNPCPNCTPPPATSVGFIYGQNLSQKTGNLIVARNLPQTVADAEPIPRLCPVHAHILGCITCPLPDPCPQEEITVGSTMAFDFKYVDLTEGGVYTVGFVQNRSDGRYNSGGLTTYGHPTAPDYGPTTKYHFKPFFYLQGVNVGSGSSLDPDERGILIGDKLSQVTIEVSPSSHIPISATLATFQMGLHVWYHSAVLIQNGGNDSNTSHSGASEAPVKVFWTGWLRPTPGEGESLPPSQSDGDVKEYFNGTVMECLSQFTGITKLEGGLYSLAQAPCSGSSMYVHTHVHKRYFVNNPPSVDTKLIHSEYYACSWWCPHLIDTNGFGDSDINDWRDEWTGKRKVKNWDWEHTKQHKMAVWNIDGNKWDVCVGSVPETPCQASCLTCAPPARFDALQEGPVDPDDIAFTLQGAFDPPIKVWNSICNLCIINRAQADMSISAWNDSSPVGALFDPVSNLSPSEDGVAIFDIDLYSMCVIASCEALGETKVRRAVRYPYHLDCDGKQNPCPERTVIYQAVIYMLISPQNLDARPTIAHELGHVLFGVGHAATANHTYNLIHGDPCTPRMSIMCSENHVLTEPTALDIEALRCLYQDYLTNWR